MDLRLAVKREYFEQIKSGVKTEEYRLMTERWIKRLNTKSYDTLTITLGYPRADDKERTLVFPFRGWSIKTITHPHFGDKPVEVFAINLVGEQNDR